MTTVSPEQFIHEVRQWKANKQTLHKVRTMKKGDFIYLKFHIPNTNEVITAKIALEDYERFNFMEIVPISIPAVWELEDPILKKLEELNANTRTLTTDWSNRLWRRQTST